MSPKIPAKSQKIHQNWTIVVYFLTFSGIFGDFFADPPKRLFLRLFCAILGPEGPETPVNGRSDRNLRFSFQQIPGISGLLETQFVGHQGVFG